VIVKVFLIGYRGAGKSTVAQPLAQRMGGDWVDTDQEIEARAKMKISDIFKDQGEEVFRDLEERVILDLLIDDDLQVLALGGGAVIRKATRERILSAGKVIWLKASAETLYDRILADEAAGQRRPNLTHGGGFQEVQEVLAEREPIYYETADYTIETEGKTPEDIAALILQVIDSDHDATTWS